MQRFKVMNSPSPKQMGSTLIISLLFLMVTTLIATGVWRIAMQQESMTGVERDYQIAFEAAEAALRDAELDFFNVCARIDTAGNNAACAIRTQPIEGETSFGSQTSGEIPSDGSCSTAGLCLGIKQTVNNVNFYEARPSLAILEGTANPSLGQRVVYGTYTRAPNTPTQAIPLVNQQPAYLIESLKFGGSSKAAATPKYRTTAIGYGRRADTRVILQSYLDPN
jgi:type IV pilus assembly protein PilX